MVHHHRAGLLAHQQQQRKAADLDLGEEMDDARIKELRGRLAEYACQHRKGHDALLRMLAGFALASCLLLLLPGSPVSAAMDELLQLGRRTRHEHEEAHSPPPLPLCSDVANGTVCCDRTALRTDVCVMRGDVRTHPADPTSLFLLVRANASAAAADERVRPYTRKWESSVMSTIDEVRLRAVPEGSPAAPARCDVRHDVPAVVFSTGGYTGNVYHEFNDGIVPLYVTARRYRRRVVFVVLEYHEWWITKYGHIVAQLSEYPPVDLANDPRAHCFPEATVGLKIHDELAVDAARMPGNESIQDFRQMLDEAYRGRVQDILKEEEQAAAAEAPGPAAAAAGKQQQQQGGIESKPAGEDESKPRLVIVSRNGSRAIENESELTRAAAATGFRVTVLRPRQDTELARMYRALNASDVMVGVHGAAMTHFLFMRPGAVFIQVVPLGTDWAAETYYGEPARRLGLRYVPYKIAPYESSLFRRYAADDPVLADPDSVNAKGWQVTKKVYLDGQNVRLDMARFRRRLREAYAHWAAQKRRRETEQRRPFL